MGCQFPGCLSQLTTLTQLTVREPRGDGIAVSLDVALRGLTQLSRLGLRRIPAASGVPAALAMLRQLEELELNLVGEPAAGSPAWSLPTGPWQRSLRGLACSPKLAACSPDFLRGAEQLKGIAFTQTPTDTEARETMAAFWLWARLHAPPARHHDSGV